MHYHKLNGTQCQSCGEGIEGECFAEGNVRWHKQCYTQKLRQHAQDDQRRPKDAPRRAKESRWTTKLGVTERQVQPAMPALTGMEEARPKTAGNTERSRSRTHDRDRERERMPKVPYTEAGRVNDSTTRGIRNDFYNDIKKSTPPTNALPAEVKSVASTSPARPAKTRTQAQEAAIASARQQARQKLVGGSTRDADYGGRF